MVQAQTSLADIRDLLEQALAGADTLNETHLGALIDHALQQTIARSGEGVQSK